MPPSPTRVRFGDTRHRPTRILDDDGSRPGIFQNSISIEVGGNVGGDVGGGPVVGEYVVVVVT